MPDAESTPPGGDGKSWLDRTLSLFTDVHAGEGATAALMLVNIFLLLICYSIIKIVREPLILLGGGAEVRSYAAAGQALVLMGYVPLYSWVASRIDRVKLLVGVTLFFVVNIELFAVAVAAGVPYVGVAFFIWVGIFNISLVAQFWSFANDIYAKETGDRLFPMIMIGMTAGAPIGSFVAGRLFSMKVHPQAIMQISAVLLAATLLLYLIVNARETRRHAAPATMLAAGGGFGLVLRSSYLRLIALLIVLLNIVNTTGEYVISRLVSGQASALAAADASFNAQAYIGAFFGDYQFWVNVTALLLQAFVAARLVKYQGLRGALLALPLIALGGYTTIAAGAGFAVVRWIKTAENATDYSIMNTARQLLWLPTSREEKYKAKQAIDTFFTRGGDLLSAAVVYLGALRMGIAGFAATNVVLTLVWIGVALMILKRHRALVRIAQTPVAASLLLGLIVSGAAGSASAPLRHEDARAAAPVENVARQQREIDRPAGSGHAAASHVSSPNRTIGACTKSEPGRSA
jgi:AAA family ATP:ADP antiporter